MVALKPEKQAPPVQIIMQDGRFYASSEANGWYDLGPVNESGKRCCECKGFEFRGTCKHVRALRLTLSCPCCEGSGEKQVTVANIITNRTHIQTRPCAGCLGVGTRQAFEELEAAAPPVARQADPLDEWRAMSEEQRKAVFA